MKELATQEGLVGQIEFREIDISIAKISLLIQNIM